MEEKKEDKEESFRQALKLKKIPILVLDQKWHRLFAIHGKTETIREVEADLNAHLARQGKLNNELKELKKLKNQLMGSIVQNMDDSKETHDKKMEETKQQIDEVNEKIDSYEDELLEIPKQIKEINNELMLLSMDYFYDKLKVNASESGEIEEWINNIRVELKKNIIRKQNRDINNREIYAYLHDIFGPDVLDLFDIKYEEEDDEEENTEGRQPKTTSE